MTRCPQERFLQIYKNISTQLRVAAHVFLSDGLWTETSNGLQEYYRAICTMQLSFFCCCRLLDDFHCQCLKSYPYVLVCL